MRLTLANLDLPEPAKEAIRQRMEKATAKPARFHLTAEVKPAETPASRKCGSC